ncbi:MAG: hypothetical protein J3R72DRAFT_507073 [Linnemannia gamsii]|nr:MAG: hypothetical protein J3R72DRAFT_507073 [Linnemannia gamsii]
MMELQNGLDALALSVAAVEYNTKTPPKHDPLPQSPPHGCATEHDLSDTGQLQACASPDLEHAYDAPPQNTTHAQQLSQIHDQQCQLELGQQRFYKQNFASYSPERSPSQLHYQNAAGVSNKVSSGVADGYTRHPETASFAQQPFDLPGCGGYSQYDIPTYASATLAWSYRLGFVEPRERSQMEMDNTHMCKTEVSSHGCPALPPLYFSQILILRESKGH